MSAETRRLLHPGQVSTVLPREARAALREASQILPNIPFGESTARHEAIALETARIKASYPQFFREDTANPAA